MMHTIFSVLALTSLINSVSARITEHEVSLIFPAGDVRQNQTITFGMGQPQWQDGLVRNFNVSLLAPNGTTVSSLSGGTNVTNENCSAAGDRASSISRAVEVVGTWTIVWNTTYTFSSDPSQANLTFCGPPPFAVETTLFNKTFGVRSDIPANVSTTPITSSTRLPGGPTITESGGPATTSTGGGKPGGAMHSVPSAGLAAVLALLYSVSLYN